MPGARESDLESTETLLRSSSQAQQGHGNRDFLASRPMRKMSLRRPTLMALVLSTMVLVSYYLFEQHSRISEPLNVIQAKPTKSNVVLLKDNATSTFRENLFSSRKYVTAFTGAGFTNQVIDAINLVYLASLTNRIPIIPQLLPEHFGGLDTVAPINFGDVFDVPRLEGTLGFPILEWYQVKTSAYSAKDASPPATEKIGCWSLQAGSTIAGGAPLGSVLTDVLKLDVSYTPVPSTFTVSHGFDPKEYVWSIWAIASLGFPQSRRENLDRQRARTYPLLGGSGETLDPDDQLLCFDSIYYTGIVNSGPAQDFFSDYSPFWNTIGVHLHWKQSFVDLAHQYLRRHFGVPEGGAIPPFISVHVRRTDFKEGCYVEFSKCFASVKAYERRVNEVKQALLARSNGIKVNAVIVTSDESDPKWWEEVAALGPGWGWIDHKAEDTAQKYGSWYPMLLDSAFQSMGTGFVGTTRSTMSYIAQKRVENWQGGVGVNVYWGTSDGDNH